MRITPSQRLTVERALVLAKQLEATASVAPIGQVLDRCESLLMGNGQGGWSRTPMRWRAWAARATATIGTSTGSHPTERQNPPAHPAAGQLEGGSPGEVVASPRVSRSTIAGGLGPIKGFERATTWLGSRTW